MESEHLEPCPMPGCGKPVEVTSAEYANVYDDFVLCTEDHCPYSATVEQHRTLARRAEIGALVERIVESHQRRVDCVRLEGRGYCAHSPSSKPPPTSPTLLDALRALAKEVGGE